MRWSRSRRAALAAAAAGSLVLLLAAGAWRSRASTAEPRPAGPAKAQTENVSFHDNPARAGDRVLRMTSSTDGTGPGTTQTQICHQRKYREGTYAARVRFRDAPTSGPRGDQLVETFYAISPLRAPMDPSYSETGSSTVPAPSCRRRRSSATSHGCGAPRSRSGTPSRRRGRA
jgi:hypothetical protein